MLEGVDGCFMTCNVFLAGNSEVSLELQCFTAELITYIMCECDAPECSEATLGTRKCCMQLITSHDKKDCDGKTNGYCTVCIVQFVQ